MDLSSTVVTFSAETGFSSFFCSPCFRLPINQMLCDHISHIFCMCPRRTCPCFDFFLHNLVLELSIQTLVFLFLASSLLCFSEPTNFFLEVFVCYSEIFTLQETLTGLYYYGKTSNTCAFISSSSLSYSPLIFLNFKFK